MQIIKELEKDEYTYQLGYTLYDNKVYPRIEIWKDKELLSIGIWNYGSVETPFYFNAEYSSSNDYGYVDTIKEMFTKLRQYNEISDNIEKEYEDMFLLYKLNNFNEI
jgi:hypothetical protein